MKISSNKYRKSTDKRQKSWTSLVGFVCAAAVYYVIFTQSSAQVGIKIHLGIIALSLIAILVCAIVKRRINEGTDLSDCKVSKINARIGQAQNAILYFVFVNLAFGLSYSRYYAFPDEPFLPFWKVGLALGLAVGIVLAILVKTNDKPIFSKVVTFLISCFLCTFLISQTLANINYAFDKTQPERYVSVIEDKDYTHHRKSADSYRFEVTVDGETFDIDVSRSIYRAFDVGDQIAFYKYSGALGKEFYVIE